MPSWKSLFVLAAIGIAQSQTTSPVMLDLGYAKYKGTYNESLQ